MDIDLDDGDSFPIKESKRVSIVVFCNFNNDWISYLDNLNERSKLIMAHLYLRHVPNIPISHDAFGRVEKSVPETKGIHDRLCSLDVLATHKQVGIRYESDRVARVVAWKQFPSFEGECADSGACEGFYYLMQGRQLLTPNSIIRNLPSIGAFRRQRQDRIDVPRFEE